MTFAPTTGEPTGRERAGRLRDAWICLGLVCAVLLVFWPTLGHQFVYDDEFYVFGNPNVLQGLNWRSVRWALTATEAGYWHPITWLSHLLDVELFGLWAPGHHAMAMGLHALNSVVLFLVLRRMTLAPWRSAVVAALFAIHPLHVESVAMVAQRKDLLSTLFWFLMLGAYASYARRPRPGAYAATAGCFALGLMAKPMLVTAPFVLLLLDFWPLRRLGRGNANLPHLLLEKLPLLAPVPVIVVLNYRAEVALGAVGNSLQSSLPLRIGNAVYAYGWYLVKTVWPTALAPHYPHPGENLPLGLAAAAAAALGLLSHWVLTNRARRPYLTTGWLWFLGTLVPAIGLIQIGDIGMADRFTYVPLVGLFLMVAWGVTDVSEGWSQRGRILAVGAAAALLALAFVARSQVRHWRDPESLWRHTLAVTRNNSRAYLNLGMTLALEGRLAEAEPYIDEMLRIEPDYMKAYVNLGAALASRGQDEDAERYLRRALQIDPSNAPAHYDLATVLARAGRSTEAVGHLREAIRLRPDLSAPYNNLGMLLAEQGEIAAARQNFEAALRIDPKSEQARMNLAKLAAGARPGRPIVPERPAGRPTPPHPQPESADGRRDRPKD